MHPKKRRHLLYAVLLLVLTIVGSSAIANTKVSEFFTNISSVGDILISLPNAVHKQGMEIKKETSLAKSNESATAAKKTIISGTAMFATIIANADDVKTCTNDGSSVARFSLCGDFDNRIVALNQAYGSYEWQQLSGCTFNVDDECPAYSCGPSSWQTVGTSATYTINAAALSSTTGGEFRVRVDGGSYYYFKVKKSSINQSYVKENYICGNPGKIQITNLSSAYEYSMDSGSGFGAWQGAIFDNLNPGTYTIKTRLKNTSNSCEYLYEPITIEQRDIDIDVTFVDAQCSGDKGKITVKVNNVPGPYKYTLVKSNGVDQEWTTYIASNTYTFPAVGFDTYSIKVETQKCKGDLANGIDPPTQAYDVNGNPIVIGNSLVALKASTEVNSSFGCNVSDVDITVRTSGGVPPYTYVVNGAGPNSASYTDESTYNVTNPGTYDFLITDANGCTITASANVKELSPPQVSVSGTDGNCTNGGAKLDINVIDAKGYNLSFRADPGDPWSNNPQLSVSAGTYQVQVRYQQGTFDCTYDVPGTVTVTTTGTISGNAVKLADESCSPGGTVGGKIEFQGPFSGGSGSGYKFSISGDSPSNFSTQTLYTDLAPGTYTPIIRDGGGCRLELTPITITEVDPPSKIVFEQSNVNCSLGTSDIKLTVTSSHPIVKYEVISPVAKDNGGNDKFVGLSSNTAYLFQVTDDNGCTYTDSFTPANLSSIRVRVKSGGDLKVCTNASDGTGTFIVDGFASNYTYNINGGVESSPQSDREIALPPSGAGTYVITVTDVDTGCDDNESITIEEPATKLSLGGGVTDMSCANSNLGRVVANASGGWGSYQYTLTEPNGNTKGPKSDKTFGNLSQAGNYTLLVTDVEGCTASFTFTLTPLSSPTIALDSGSSSLCYAPGVGATLAVTASGGVPGSGGYEYRINGGSWQSTPVFSNLTPGNYTIEVKDSNNCKDNINETINPQLRVNASVDTEIPCGGPDGSLRVEVSGGYLSGAGTKQYEVSSDNGVSFGAPVTFTSNTFNYDTNTPGKYVFRITDKKGCIATSNPVALDPAMAINANAEVIGASCGNPNNGIVIITPDATIGLPPYEISFNGGPFSGQKTYSSLSAGQTYSYVVRDARGCLFADSVTIGNNPNPAPDATVSSVDATCSPTGVSGEINITSVTGGTPNFTYIIQNQFGVEIARQGPTSSTTASFTGLAPNSYNVITLDKAGCRDIDVVTIDQNTVDVVPEPVPTPTCSATGYSRTVDIIGGVGPAFEIRLVANPANAFEPTNAGPRRHTFTGLQLGVSYSVQVKDLGTGCIYWQSLPPVTGSSLTVNADSSPGFCASDRKGEITYEIGGFNLGDQIKIELLDNGTHLRTVLETLTPTSVPYANSTYALAGNYQIIATNLSDNDCTSADDVTIQQNLPSMDILVQLPANCSANGEITVRGYGGNGGPYKFAYMPQGTPPLAGDFIDATTYYAPAGNYDVYVKDVGGCTSFEIATVIQLNPPLPDPTVDVVNQCDDTATSFAVNVSVPASVDTPRFTLGGVEKFGVYNVGSNRYEFTYYVNAPGSYPIKVSDANGCVGSGTAKVYEFLSASGDFTVQPTCNNPDGTITIVPDGGSNNFSYQLRDSGGNDLGSPVVGDRTQGIIDYVAPGTYTVEVTDTETGCSKTVDVQLEAATPPIIDSVIKNDVTCQGSDNGSINIEIRGGTDLDSPLEFRLLDFNSRAQIASNASGTFNDLPVGTYDVEVVSARNCTATAGLIEITEPPKFSISASAPDFSCEIGAHRYSATTIKVAVDPSEPGTPDYQYSITGWENYQTSDEFEIVDNGSAQNITVYAVDGNGCHATASVSLAPPTDVVPSPTLISVLDCKDPEKVRIDVTGTTNFTVNTISVTPIAPVVSTGNTYVELDLPDSGDYLFEVVDNSLNGCTYPLPKYHVDEPLKPKTTISEAKPVTCFGASDGALNITVDDYVGVYDYEVFTIDAAGAETSVKTGSFDTNNFPDVNGDPALITGLAGGNYIVKVSSRTAPFCSTSSNVATVRSPSAALDVTTSETGNVSCSDDTGKIVANATGGWDVSPYEYSLSKDDGTGTYVEVVPWGAAAEFENLAHGKYRVTVKDIRGCEHTSDIELKAIPPITAGIREPVELVCTDGNNAVLEAYELSTGNAGAEGGVPSAGYKYQLLYLGSDDKTDITSTSGLQDVPQFSGDTGGFISTGWYAIKIVSGYSCEGVTEPYFVKPPPPIIPNLVQVQAPGCGGQGQMRLSIVNPQIGYSYEYRSVSEVDPAPYTPFTGTSVLIDEDAGFYQYNVRKTGSTLTCNDVKSPGVTLVDAEAVQLITNLPDDISCFSELDGRIESFADGGLGNYKYTLYEGDPGSDPFNPNASATIVRSAQDYGTFESLPEGYEYYIGVTSGTSCGDVKGPLEIKRPEQIVVKVKAHDVLCHDDTNGEIEIEVTSGGVGLLQFAISPNFNEFFSDPVTPRKFKFDDLAPGSYEVLIQDEKGCTVKQKVTIGRPDELKGTSVQTPETCINAADGTAQLTVTGGMPFTAMDGTQYYETSLNSSDDADFVRNDNLFFDNLIGGETYVVFIRDVNGCTTNVIFPIGVGVDLAAEAIPEYGCQGIFPNSTVTVKMKDESLVPQLLFSLDVDDIAMADTKRTFGDLPPGDHTVYIYHENGCSTFVEFTIDAYNPLTLDAVKTGPNEITATATGGFGNYEYFFQGQSQGSDNVYTLNEDKDVTIMVRDAKGCEVSVTIPFDFTGVVEFPNFFTPDGDNKNDVWKPKNMEYFPNIEVIIYDRYGRVVVRLDQVTSWDGTYDGKELPSGDYWYVVNANDKDKQQYVGHFTLYR